MDLSNRQQVVAAFDFDGTLTTSDTLIAFIRFTHGRRRLLWGFLRQAPWLVAMKLGIYPNWKAKEKIFSHFYQGITYKQFIQWGRDFADVAVTMLNSRTITALQHHQAEGHAVCVVTASIDEWVRPICERLGVDAVLATLIEVSHDGIVTGRFLSPNCYGAQKVARLLEAYPERPSYKLHAYGDSRGDNELLALADKAFRI